MPHDYDDDDEAGFGLREHIDEASSVDASGGYSIPSVPFIIAPYRSLAVFVKPSGGGSFSVKVTWDQDGIAGGATAEETKASTLADGETLIFRNQGVQVTDVEITASADTAYAVMPSDVDPLADSAADANQWPFEYECIDLGSLSDGTGVIAPGVAYWTNSGWKSVVDATFYRGFYFDSTNAAGKEIIFAMRLGGKGSMWLVQPVVAIGPAEGKMLIEFGQSSHGEDAPGAGDPDDANIIFDTNALPHPADLVNVPVNWYTCSPSTLDLGAVGLTKIAVQGTLSQFRVMGDVGEVLSANAAATFGRGYTARDFATGGPGIWYMRLTSQVGSTGAARVRISSLRVVRQTVFDYVTV